MLYYFVALGFVLVVLLFLVLYFSESRKKTVFKHSLTLAVFKIEGVSDSKLDVSAQSKWSSFFNDISGEANNIWKGKLPGPFSFEIIIREYGASYFVHIPVKDISKFEKVWQDYFPEFILTPTEDYNIFALGGSTKVLKIIPRKNDLFFVPLRGKFISELTDSLPNDLSDSDTISIQYLLSPQDGRWKISLERTMGLMERLNLPFDKVRNLSKNKSNNTLKKQQLSSDVLRELASFKEKLSSSGFSTHITVISSSSEQKGAERGMHLFQRILSNVQNTKDGINFLQVHPQVDFKTLHSFIFRIPPPGKPFLFTARELAQLFRTEK